MSAAIFRILSGVHAGAVIELTTGSWVIGRDASADVILTDKGLAPRHAAFSVDEKGIVRYESLDGTVLTVDEKEPAEGPLLVAGRLWRMGPVIFTWGSPEAGDDFWQEVERALEQHFERAAAPRPAEAGTPEERGGDAGSEQPVPAAAPGSEAVAAQDAPTQKDVRRGSGWGVGLALAVFAVLAGGFVLMLDPSSGGWAERWPGTARTLTALKTLVVGEAPVPTDVRIAAVEEKLRAQHFTNVVATVTTTGAVRLEGTVADDAARGRLVRFARTLDVPAVLDVRVESDRVEPLRAALETLGFNARVTLEKASAGRPEKLVVAAYMRSGAVEEKAFIDARALVPALAAGSSSLEVERRIRHEADIAPLVREALSTQGIRNVAVTYLPGRIELRKELAPGEGEKLARAAAAIERTADVPLAVDVVNERVAAASAVPVRAVKSTSAAQPSAARTGFKVTSVSSGAIPFVTLETGERVFVGGKLPGGFVLEAIEGRRLRLSRDGRRFDHPLTVK